MGSLADAYPLTNVVTETTGEAGGVMRDGGMALLTALGIGGAVTTIAYVATENKKIAIAGGILAILIVYGFMQSRIVSAEEGEAPTGAVVKITEPIYVTNGVMLR